MLTTLALTFMGLARSNSDDFSAPGFIVSPVGKRKKGEEKNKGSRERE